MPNSDALKMLMLSPETHLVNWCILNKNKYSAGTIINELMDSCDDSVNIWQAANGVLLELDMKKAEQLYPDNTDWIMRAEQESKVNKILFKVDMKILYAICKVLQNNGLNTVVQQAQKDTPALGFYYFILYLVNDLNTCHYADKIRTKLNGVLERIETLNKAICAIRRYVKNKGNSNSNIMTNIAEYLLDKKVFDLPESDWRLLVNNLIMQGCIFESENMNTQTLDEECKIDIIEKYLLKMIDRKVFQNIYQNGGTFTWEFGCYGTDNNYIVEHNGLDISSYKLPLTEQATILFKTSGIKNILIKGIDSTDVAVDFGGLTSFTAIEMLKMGIISDGDNGIILQAIIHFGD